MPVYTLVESRWTEIDISNDQAEALRGAGERLVSATPYYGNEPEDEAFEREGAPESRSAVRTELRTDGTVRVMVPNRVGVLAVDDILIRVIPKVSESHVLHLMRSTQAGLGAALTVDEARVLAGREGGFWEVLAHSFATEGERLVRGGLVLDYEERTESLAYSRGRVIPLPTARSFYAGSLEFRCQFEDLTLDTPMNRILLAAANRVASSRPLSKELRGRAAAIGARLEGVGDLRLEDFAVEIDRRSWHYRHALPLAMDVLHSSARGWSEGSVATAFLIQTPILVQEGLTEILKKRFLPGSTVRARRLRLHGQAGATVNPDLVFGPGNVAVADVKYHSASAKWDRKEVYQVTSFAAHLGTNRAAIIDFCEAGWRRFSLGIGLSPEEAIWVSHIAWPAKKTRLDKLPAEGELSPEEAEEKFVAEVGAWLELHGDLLTQELAS